jgi:hypothetical protein
VTTIQAQGHLATVTFDGDTVTITRKPFKRLTAGSSEKRIPVRAINAIQIKPAGRLTTGFIEFTISGGKEHNSPLRQRAVDVANNENAVVFARGQQSEFEALRDAVEAALGQPRDGGEPGLAEQLAQLGELHRTGVLSGEEFAAAKRKLLG